MVRWIKGPWGVCQRTERKVPLRDLVEDGEIRGLLVTRDDADRDHSQKYVRAIHDPTPIHRPSPQTESESVSLRIGTLGSVQTGAVLYTPALALVLQPPVVEVS